MMDTTGIQASLFSCSHTADLGDGFGCASAFISRGVTLESSLWYSSIMQAPFLSQLKRSWTLCRPAPPSRALRVGSCASWLIAATKYLTACSGEIAGTLIPVSDMTISGD